MVSRKMTDVRCQKTDDSDPQSATSGQRPETLNAEPLNHMVAYVKFNITDAKKIGIETKAMPFFSIYYYYVSLKRKST